MAVIRHADSWVEPHQLGRGLPYRPTHSSLLTLGETHRHLLEAPLKPNSVCIDIGIPGSLRREDAAKLYELAHYGDGDVLVLGVGHGLATAIIAQAILDAGRSGSLVGVDENPRKIARTRANLSAFNLEESLKLVQKSPASYCKSHKPHDRKFGLVFVDHSTAYPDVVGVCRLLGKRVSEGGFVLFHDFNDRRNKERANGGYGVYSGVVDGLPVPPFAFFGVYGCTGLYRREAVEAFGADRSPHMVDSLRQTDVGA